MDRLLCHHLRSGDGTEAHKPVAAQDVRQGEDAVGDEPEEAEQRQHGEWDRQQQDPARNVRVSIETVR